VQNAMVAVLPATCGNRVTKAIPSTSSLPDPASLSGQGAHPGPHRLELQTGRCLMRRISEHCNPVPKLPFMPVAKATSLIENTVVG